MTIEFMIFGLPRKQNFRNQINVHPGKTTNQPFADVSPIKNGWVFQLASHVRPWKESLLPIPVTIRSGLFMASTSKQRKSIGTSPRQDLRSKIARDPVMESVSPFIGVLKKNELKNPFLRPIYVGVISYNTHFFLVGIP